MKLIELGGDVEEQEHARSSWLKLGPPPKIRPHEPDTWKIFFGMGLATGAIFFGARARAKGGKGFVP